MQEALKEAKIEDLNVGDLIYLEWWDASGWDRKRLPKRGVECVISRVGWFLGLKGKEIVHLVVAHEKVPEPQVFSFDVIPVNLIKFLEICVPQHLQKRMPHVFKELKKHVFAMPDNHVPRFWEVKI